MQTMTRRTDVHRPSAMDPADYVLVGEADDHHSEGFFDFDWQRYAELKNAPELADRDYRDAEGIEWDELTGRGACCHCGNRRIRYWAFFLHVPTGKVVAVGNACAGKLGLKSRDDLKRREQVQRERMAAKLAEWRAADPRNEQAYAELLRQEDEAGGSGSNDFVDSLLRYARGNGGLTVAQREAVIRGIEARAQRAQERAERDAKMGDPEPADVPLTGDRMTITGRLVTTKSQQGYGGRDEMKMLVIDDRGFRVWGTLPGVIVDQAFEQSRRDGYTSGGVQQALQAGMKCRVEFTAKVERSRKDSTFGFFSRPTKAKVI